MIPKFVFLAKEKLIQRKWGGEWIPMMKGFKQEKIGESIEFSNLQENPSELLIGNETISAYDFFVRYKKEVLGELANKYEEFPITVKLIDAKDKTDEFKGSEKIWLCLSDGYIYIGEDVFNVTKFDAFLIPSDVKHSAEGIRIFEVSYGFKTHEELSRFKKKIESKILGVEVLEVLESKKIELNTFNLLFLLDGYAVLKSERDIADIHKGYSCLIPAMTSEFEIKSERAVFIRVYPLCQIL